MLRHVITIETINGDHVDQHCIPTVLLPGEEKDLAALAEKNKWHEGRTTWLEIDHPSEITEDEVRDGVDLVGFKNLLCGLSLRGYGLIE